MKKWLPAIGTAVVVALVTVLGWFWSAVESLRRGRAQAHSDKLAEEFKQKVVAAKAASAQRKAETDAAVAKVDETAALERQADSVEFANALIADEQRKGG